MSNGVSTNEAVIAAINDVKSEMRGVRTELGGVNRELGGVQATLTSMEKSNTKRDHDIENIRKGQAECQARADHAGVNARLKKIEAKDAEDTGKIDVYAQRTAALEMVVKKNGNGNGKNGGAFVESIKRMAPWLVVAVLVGASLGGYLLAQSLMAGITP